MTVPSGVCAGARPATATRASAASARLRVHFQCAYILFLLLVSIDSVQCLLRHANGVADQGTKLRHHLRAGRQRPEHRPPDVCVSLRRTVLGSLATAIAG